MSSHRRSRKQQTRIAFTPISSTSPAAKDYHEQIQNRAASVRYEPDGMSPLKKRKVNFSSPVRASGSNQYLPTPDTPSFDTIEPATTSQKQQRKASKKSRQSRLDVSTFTSSPFAASSPVRPASTSNGGEVADAVSSDSDQPQTTRSKKRKRLSQGFMSSGTIRSSRSQRRLDPLVADEPEPAPVQLHSDYLEIDQDSSDNDSDMPTTIGTQRRGAQKRQRSPSIEPPSESEVEIVSVSKRKSTRDVSDDDDDDDDDVEPITPKRRLLKRPRKITQEEKDDLAEDLDFIGPGSEDDTPKPPRGTQAVQKAARASALEALKRKRAGIVDDPEPEVDNDEDELGQDHEDDFLPTSSRSVFQADAEDEDFLDDDNADGELGVPDTNLPIEFSQYATAKPKELFKFAIQWMVHKKLNPAFNSEDELYELAFRKLNDEVSGLVNSKFSSSAWSAEFVLALRARPEMAIDETGVLDDINGFGVSHCDACNRSGHPATRAVQFSGKPYNPHTLDDVEDEGNDDDASSGDDSDVDDKPAYDSQGHKLAPASKIYHCGRHCTGNAEMAHQLAHWKYNLYCSVMQWITEAKYNTPAMVLERDKMSAKKRRKLADKVAGRMYEQGVVKKLWEEFSLTIEMARNHRQDRY